MIKFIPAILASTLPEYDGLMHTLSRLVDEVHVDFADNSFVQNKTLLPSDLTHFPAKVDAHLMVNQPSSYFDELVRLGARRTTCHIESTEELDSIIASANQHNLGLSLAINPETSLDLIDPFIDRIYSLQLMGIQPGFGNQPFLESTFDRIRLAKERFPSTPIAVDGGVRFHNAKQLADSGATILIVGKGGWSENGNIEAGINKWQSLTQEL